MEKAFNTYSLKSMNLSVKDLDMGKRLVSFYLSKFDSIDSDNDLIARGAFTKSIQERGVNSESNRKIAYLRYHDWHMPIGKFVELKEDSEGLYAVGQLSRSDDGKNAMIDYEEGIIREHSIGFKYMKDKVRWIEDSSMELGGYYLVSEVQLYEGSAVTFGANEYTNVVEVAKSEGKENVIKKISDDIDAVTKSLIKGVGTDDRLYNLEMKLKFLNSRLIELAKINPHTKQLIVDKPTNDVVEFDWNKVIKGI